MTHELMTPPFKYTSKIPKKPGWYLCHGYFGGLVFLVWWDPHSKLAYIAREGAFEVTIKGSYEGYLAWGPKIDLPPPDPPVGIVKCRSNTLRLLQKLTKKINGGQDQGR